MFAKGLTALALAHFVASAASAEPVKIGFVDFQRAIQETDAGKSAKAQLEKEITTRRTKFENMQKEIQGEWEKFEKSATVMNEKKRAEKGAEIQKRFMDLQRQAAEAEGDLRKREGELLKPLSDDLKAVIDGVGKEKGFHLIVDRQGGGVLYAQGATDVTDAVIAKFNAKRKSSKGKS